MLCKRSLSGEKFQVVVVSLDQDVDVVKKFMEENKLDAFTPMSIDANDDISKLRGFVKDAAGVPVSLILKQPTWMLLLCIRAMQIGTVPMHRPSSAISLIICKPGKSR
jgi:hypothetical protein